MDKLPKFMICEPMPSEGMNQYKEVEFILHTEFPAFVAVTDEEEDEFGGLGITPIHWFQEPTGLDVSEMARLMREMGDWYVRCCAETDWLIENQPDPNDDEIFR